MLEKLKEKDFCFEDNWYDDYDYLPSQALVLKKLFYLPLFLLETSETKKRRF